MEYEKGYGHRPEFCPAIGFQDVMVGVPVEVKPFAEVGKVKLECLGKPIIRKGTTHCEGKHKETCKFTISQKMRIEVPVAFSAKTEVGPAMVDCKCREHMEEIHEEEGCKEPGCMGMIG